MLLVVTYSKPARQTLRNICRAHEDVVVRRFGRAALFEASGCGAFQALRLREKYGTDVQIDRTHPLNEYAEVPPKIRRAVAAYERRDHPHLPYTTFVARRPHPDPEQLRSIEL